jgi:gliding motility-associated protein GldC
MKKSDILFQIELDENHVPEKIKWSAEDGGINAEETKATLISVWDDKKMEALRVDLWTKEMPMDHMKRFIHQIFLSLANTYERATNDKAVSESILDFAEQFAKESKIK